MDGVGATRVDAVLCTRLGLLIVLRLDIGTAIEGDGIVNVEIGNDNDDDDDIRFDDESSSSFIARPLNGLMCIGIDDDDDDDVDVSSSVDVSIGTVAISFAFLPLFLAGCDTGVEVSMMLSFGIDKTGGGDDTCRRLFNAVEERDGTTIVNGTLDGDMVTIGNALLALGDIDDGIAMDDACAGTDEIGDDDCTFINERRCCCAISSGECTGIIICDDNEVGVVAIGDVMMDGTGLNDVIGAAAIVAIDDEASPCEYLHAAPKRHDPLSRKLKHGDAGRTATSG